MACNTSLSHLSFQTRDVLLWINQLTSIPNAKLKNLFKGKDDLMEVYAIARRYDTLRTKTL